jgi:hypothetical protein
MDQQQSTSQTQTSPHLVIKEITKCDTKPVRPKRKYVKKEDRLKGVICHEGKVVVRFD